VLIDPVPRPRLPINFRSVALGLAGVLFICAFTPYNDYALNNTFLIGNNLPLGVVMFSVPLHAAGQRPLSKYAPRLALSSGEVTVAFSMMLVSCAIPSSGLMRGFPASLVVPFHLAAAMRSSCAAGVDEPAAVAVPQLQRRGAAAVGERSDRPGLHRPVDRRNSPIPYAKWTVPIFAWSCSCSRCTAPCCAW
jgi:hypothetical protein